MRSVARASLFLLLFSSISLCALAQSSRKSGTAVITGRITSAGKPLPNIVVVLVPSEPGAERSLIAKATTDFEGNYRLTGVPAGRFNVTPVAPTMVGPSDPMYSRLGRPIIVDEGETVEKIDFTLTRGGVITGRITDADGKPVIEERVQVNLADASSRRSSFYGLFSNPFMFMTDDRGVYRIYGVPAGKYTVSAGVSPQDGMMGAGLRRRSYYERTFYPGETDAKLAAAVEVTEGGEVKDVDIKLGRRAQTFAVSGRVVDAETGKPVPNVRIGFGPYRASDRRLMGYGFAYNLTDASGQFKIEGVAPGSFAAFVVSESDGYSEPVPFEITDADVGGLEVKLRHGAALSGVVQLEGTTDKRVFSRLQKLYIGAYMQSEKIAPPELRPSTIGADGSFRLTGLPPGKAMLYVQSYPEQKDLRIARVEIGGVAQPNGIDVSPGAEITNVRVVFEYGNGSIRGQVRVENGELPEGTTMFIMIAKASEEQNPRPLNSVMVDSRGRFLIEGLPTGDYQLTLQFRLLQEVRRRLPNVKQNVTVTNGMATETTIVLDLAGTEVKEQ